MKFVIYSDDKCEFIHRQPDEVKYTPHAHMAMCFKSFDEAKNYWWNNLVGESCTVLAIVD